MDSSSHDGRVAVVTGAAGGIGNALCLGLAARGARVVAVDLRAAEAVVDEVVRAGGECVAIRADVSSETEVAALPRAVEEHFGPCDILVNNAGIGVFRRLADTDYATWRKIIHVNLDSQFLMSKAFVPGMAVKGWGRIVNVSSTSLYGPIPGLTAYMASKGGILGLTSALANDVAEQGITVNAVSPSMVPGTGLGADYSDPDNPTPGPVPPDEMKDLIIASQAIKRLATPRDIVGLVQFLTSDDAYFITAQFIVADGGATRM